MPGNYSLALQINCHFLQRQLVTGTDDTLRVLKSWFDRPAAQAILMSYHLRGGTVPCLGSKQSLSNALHSKAIYRPSPQLRASRKTVVVRALQKTRVVRGKCYVTKDVSTLLVQPLVSASRHFYQTWAQICLAEH